MQHIISVHLLYEQGDLDEGDSDDIIKEFGWNAKTESMNENFLLYDEFGRKRFQYLLSIVYANAFNTLKILRATMRNCTKERRKDGGEFMKPRRVKPFNPLPFEERVEQVMNRTEDAFVWLSLWKGFIDVFSEEELLIKHLRWLQEACDITSTSVEAGCYGQMTWNDEIDGDDEVTSAEYNRLSGDGIGWSESAIKYVNLTTQYLKCFDELDPCFVHYQLKYKPNVFNSLKGYFKNTKLSVLEAEPTFRDQR